MVLIRLAAVERGSFHRDDATVETSEDDASRRMCGIEDVVRQRRHGVLGARGPVHERYGPESGLTHEGARGRDVAPSTERNAPGCGELHEEIVRVLVVGDLKSLVCLAYLEDLGESEAGRSQRLGGEHAGGAKRSGSEPATCGGHEPVL
jgi:hypothetical protein